MDCIQPKFKRSQHYQKSIKIEIKFKRLNITALIKSTNIWVKNISGYPVKCCCDVEYIIKWHGKYAGFITGVNRLQISAIINKASSILCMEGTKYVIVHVQNNTYSTRKKIIRTFVQIEMDYIGNWYIVLIIWVTSVLFHNTEEVTLHDLKHNS